MDSDDQIFESTAIAAPGAEHLCGIVGSKLLGLTRFLFGPEGQHIFGDGMVEAEFDTGTLSFVLGENEGNIVIQNCEIQEDKLDAHYWTKAELSTRQCPAIGKRLLKIDVFTDGLVDVAFIFCFESGAGFSIVLSDSEMLVGRELELFEFDRLNTIPLFRATIPGPPCRPKPAS